MPDLNQSSYLVVFSRIIKTVILFFNYIICNLTTMYSIIILLCDILFISLYSKQDKCNDYDSRVQY